MVEQGRALVVEDDRLVRPVLGRLVRRLGMTVDLAPDGLAGLDFLREGPGFDLVVTDLRMPGASGIEVAHFALGLEPAPRVVVVSGFASQDEERAIVACGAHLLRKPFELQEALDMFEGRERSVSA